MQSSKHGAVREGELSLPVSPGCNIVAQEGTYTVEVTCFMGGGDPFPVAVPVRDFGHEGRGSLPNRMSSYRSNEGNKAGRGCNCNQKKCDAFYKGFLHPLSF